MSNKKCFVETQNVWALAKYFIIPIDSDNVVRELCTQIVDFTDKMKGCFPYVGIMHSEIDTPNLDIVDGSGVIVVPVKFAVRAIATDCFLSVEDKEADAKSAYLMSETLDSSISEHIIDRISSWGADVVERAPAMSFGYFTESRKFVSCEDCSAVLMGVSTSYLDAYEDKDIGVSFNEDDCYDYLIMTLFADIEVPISDFGGLKRFIKAYNNIVRALIAEKFALDFVGFHIEDGLFQLEFSVARLLVQNNKLTTIQKVLQDTNSELMQMGIDMAKILNDSELADILHISQRAIGYALLPSSVIHR